MSTDKKVCGVESLSAEIKTLSNSAGALHTQLNRKTVCGVESLSAEIKSAVEGIAALHAKASR